MRMSQINQKCPKLISSNCRLLESSNFQLHNNSLYRGSPAVGEKVIKLPIIKIIHSLVIWFLTTWMTDRRPWHWSLSTEGPKIIQNLLQQSFRNRTKPIFLSNQVCAINASAAFPGVIISFPGDNVLHVTHRLTPFCHSSGRANLLNLISVPENYRFLSRSLGRYLKRSEGGRGHKFWQSSPD